MLGAHSQRLAKDDSLSTKTQDIKELEEEPSTSGTKTERQIPERWEQIEMLDQRLSGISFPTNRRMGTDKGIPLDKTILEEFLYLQTN